MRAFFRLEFEIVHELEPNAKMLEIIKDYDYTIRNGKIKHLKDTNLQFIEPIEYLIAYPTTLAIPEYKVNEIANKPFYIKEHKQMKDNNAYLKEAITKQELEKLQEDYFVFFNNKIAKDLTIKNKCFRMYRDRM